MCVRVQFSQSQSSVIFLLFRVKRDKKAARQMGEVSPKWSLCFWMLYAGSKRHDLCSQFDQIPLKAPVFRGRRQEMLQNLRAEWGEV